MNPRFPGEPLLRHRGRSAMAVSVPVSASPWPSVPVLPPFSERLRLFQSPALDMRGEIV